MFWQKEYVREAVSMTLNSTYIQELPKHGLLGALLIRITGAQTSGYGQTGGDWRIVDEISKVEIIGDGATVIKSITGPELQALGFYDQWVAAPDPYRNYGANTQRFYALLNFGRHLYDPLLGLDLSRFKTVEIKITNTAVSGTDFGDLTVSLLAFYMREPGDKKWLGYMRTEEWRSWTTVQNETRYFELPTEHVLRRILLRAVPLETLGIGATTMEDLMDDIDLSLDTGVVRLFKGGIDDLIRENFYDYRGYVLTGGQFTRNADRGVRDGQGYRHAFVGGAAAQDGAGAATIATLEGARTDHTLKPETYEIDSPIQFLSLGAAYHQTAVLRFDQDPDPGSWLDPAKRRTVLLNIHSSDESVSASGTDAIVLDRLVKY